MYRVVIYLPESFAVSCGLVQGMVFYDSGIEYIVEMVDTNTWQDGYQHKQLPFLAKPKVEYIEKENDVISEVLMGDYAYKLIKEKMDGSRKKEVNQRTSKRRDSNRTESGSSGELKREA